MEAVLGLQNSGDTFIHSLPAFHKTCSLMRVLCCTVFKLSELGQSGLSPRSVEKPSSTLNIILQFLAYREFFKGHCAMA